MESAPTLPIYDLYLINLIRKNKIVKFKPLQNYGKK